MTLAKRAAGSLMGGLRAEPQTQITVKFQSAANQIAGGVFDLRVIKSDINAVP